MNSPQDDGASTAASRAARKLIVLGVMAWAEDRDIPRSRRSNARRRFSAIILKASQLGFQDSAKLRAGLRSGRATPKVLERAEEVCALVSEAEIDAELRSAAALEREVGVFGSPRRAERPSP